MFTPKVTVQAPLRPFGKQRPRFAHRGKWAVAYKSQEQLREEEALVFYVLQAKQAAGLEALLAGPIAVDLTVSFQVPASYSKAKRARALAGMIYPLIRPDVDNLLKHFLDVATGVLWRDDAQVVRASVVKVYGEEVGWRAVVSEFGQ